MQPHEQEVAQLRSDLEAFSRVAAELQRTRYALAEVSDRLADSNRELALARASSDRLAEQLARMTAERDHLQTQVRSEQIKAQSASRDVEKIQKQTSAERQSILDVLNDLVVEHTALKQTADRQALEATEEIADCKQQLSDVTATLKDVRESISFRLLVTAGRPVAALLRLFTARGEKTN